MTTLTHRLLPFLADVTIRVTVLLALTAGIALLSRRASASFRHLVWSLGLVCALLLPPLTVALPRWQIAVRASAPLPKPAALTPQDTEALPAVSHKATVPPLTPPRLDAPADAPVHHAMPLPIPVSAPSSAPLASAPAAPFPWIAGVVLLWASGVFLVLAQLAQGLATVRRVGRESVPVTDGPAADAMVAAQTLMRVGRPVALRQASRTGAVTVPLTYGALRPVIMLPAEAVQWPQERMRAVLLHEMAHIRRGDWPWHLLAHVARAVYWFHPLVWLSARRARMESETAADDLVLSMGMPPQDYARHLLDVAVAARRVRGIGAGAVAMAQGPKVEGRLRLILALGRSRGEVAGVGRVAVLAVALVVALPLAALRLSPSVRAQNVSEKDTPSVADATQAVPGGGTLTLVGVSYSPPAHHPWWGKDGVILPHAPSFGQSEGTVTEMPNSQVRVFALEGSRIGTDADFTLAVPTASATSSWTELDGRGTSRLRIVAALPASAHTCTVRVGVATQGWQTVAADDASQLPLGQGESDSSSAGGASFDVMFSPSTTVRGKLALTVSDTISDQASRIVALDRQGKTVVPETLNSARIGNLTQRTVVFPNLMLRDIKSVQVQARPYHWIEFQNVPLQPLSSPSVSSGGLPQTTGDTASAHVARGLQLQQHGQPRDGIPDFRRAIQLDPNNAQAQYQLADALFNIKSKHFVAPHSDSQVYIGTPAPALREAILHMQKAVSLRPDNAWWHETLAMYLADGGRDAEAVAEFRQTLHLLPVVPPINLDRPQPAAIEPSARSFSDAQFLLANALLKVKQYQEAIGHYQQALRFHPMGEDDILIGYGDALNGEGRHAEARAAWKKALTIQPPNPYEQRRARARLRG